MGNKQNRKTMSDTASKILSRKAGLHSGNSLVISESPIPSQLPNGRHHISLFDGIDVYSNEDERKERIEELEKEVEDLEKDLQKEWSAGEVKQEQYNNALTLIEKIDCIIRGGLTPSTKIKQIEEAINNANIEY